MKKEIQIEGMSCNHCVNHVTEALKELGAKDISVSLDNKLAVAEISEDISDEALKAAIEDAGYDVTKIEKV